MNKKQELEQSIWRRKLAPAAAALALSAGLATYEVSETPTAEAAVYGTQETILHRTDKQLIAIDTQIRSMIDQGIGGAYTEPVFYNGIKVNRNVVIFGAKLPGATNKMTYTHLVEEIIPGDNVPFMVSTFRNVQGKNKARRYVKGETYENATLIFRKPDNHTDYSILSFYKDEKLGMTENRLNLSGKTQSLVRGLNQDKTQPISRVRISESLENVTADAIDWLKYAESEYIRQYRLKA